MPIGIDAIGLLCEGLRSSEEWQIRRELARSLGQCSRGDRPSVDALLNGLLDSDNDVRDACARSLAQISQQHPSASLSIEERLFTAIDDPVFDQLDKYERHPGYDYVYDALWMLVTGEQVVE